MEIEVIYEILGYVASIFVAISLMMSSIIKLRVINFVGAVLFSIYGFLIGALPVGVLNGLIAVFNIYHLSRLTRKEESFKIKAYNTVESDLLNVFFEFYSHDIKNFFPEFEKDLIRIKQEKQFSVVIFRNNVPAGVLVGFKEGDNLNVVIDYAVPEYRDFKLANYLYTNKKIILLNENINKVITVTTLDKHKKYLQKLNFNQVKENRFELVL